MSTARLAWNDRLSCAGCVRGGRAFVPETRTSKPSRFSLSFLLLLLDCVLCVAFGAFALLWRGLGGCCYSLLLLGIIRDCTRISFARRVGSIRPVTFSPGLGPEAALSDRAYTHTHYRDYTKTAGGSSCRQKRAVDHT